MKPRPKRNDFTMRLSEEERELIDRLAERLECSRSDAVRQVIWLKAQDLGLVAADADTGNADRNPVDVSLLLSLMNIEANNNDR